MPRSSVRLQLALGAALLATAAAACGSDVIVDDYSGTDVRTVAADSVLTGVSRFYSGLTESATYVVRTPAEWEALWTKAVGTQRPVPPTPSVDFSRYMVLVVAMGARSTGGYGVSIDRVTDTSPRDRVVESTFARPAGDCIVTDAFTAPFAAVLAPASDATVHFVNRSVEHHCS